MCSRIHDTRFPEPWNVLNVFIGINFRSGSRVKDNRIITATHFGSDIIHLIVFLRNKKLSEFKNIRNLRIFDEFSLEKQIIRFWKWAWCIFCSFNWLQWSTGKWDSVRKVYVDRLVIISASNVKCIVYINSTDCRADSTVTDVF